MLKSMQNLTWCVFTAMSTSKVTADTQSPISLMGMLDLGTLLPNFYFPEAFHNPGGIPRGAALF